MRGHPGLSNWAVDFSIRALMRDDPSGVYWTIHSLAERLFPGVRLAPTRIYCNSCQRSDT